METELFTMNDSELDSSTIKNKQANKKQYNKWQNFNAV